MKKIKKEISVVNDQIGSPTSSNSLAKICWETIKIKTSSKNNYLPEIYLDEKAFSITFIIFISHTKIEFKYAYFIRLLLLFFIFFFHGTYWS